MISNYCCSNNPDMNNKTPNYLKVVITLTLINLVILETRNLVVGDSFFNFLTSKFYILVWAVRAEQKKARR